MREITCQKIKRSEISIFESLTCLVLEALQQLLRLLFFGCTKLKHDFCNVNVKFQSPDGHRRALQYMTVRGCRPNIFIVIGRNLKYLLQGSDRGSRSPHQNQVPPNFQVPPLILLEEPPPNQQPPQNFSKIRQPPPEKSEVRIWRLLEAQRLQTHTHTHTTHTSQTNFKVGLMIMKNQVQPWKSVGTNC